jgi:phospholipase C
MVIKQSSAATAALLLAACGANRTGSLPTASSAAYAVKTPIKHVVFVIQENRSFNDLFMGYPGAKTAKYGYDRNGGKIVLQPRSLADTWDAYHSSSAFFRACDGQGNLPGTKCKMDGWDQEGADPHAPKHLAYSYVPQSDVGPYWTIAHQYVLADRMFATNLDGSFVAHQYAVAAYAAHSVNYPLTQWGCEGGSADTVETLLADRSRGPSIPACFDYPTLASEADAAGVTWRFYAGTIYGDGGLWSSYQADRAIYHGHDWHADVMSPPSKFLRDIGRGELAAITWITPTWEDSDHPSGDPAKGPQWIASLVNAIGTSEFWNSTAIFIMWDDWGGWFDPVPPPHKDYDGLGFRVPLLIVSPYAKQGYVTHVEYETASVLRYMEDNFGLAHLAASDTRARDPASDVFDYHQKPRAFKRIEGGMPAQYWIELERASHTAPWTPTPEAGD